MSYHQLWRNSPRTPTWTLRLSQAMRQITVIKTISLTYWPKVTDLKLPVVQSTTVEMKIHRSPPSSKSTWSQKRSRSRFPRQRDRQPPCSKSMNLSLSPSLMQLLAPPRKWASQPKRVPPLPQIAPYLSSRLIIQAQRRLQIKEVVFWRGRLREWIRARCN